MEAAAPRHWSKKINWAAGACGVVKELHGSRYTALLLMRRSGDPPGQVYIEDLGTHSKPWFAGVCHDVMLLKAAWEGGNKSFEGLERAHLPSSSRERLLNFPLSCYTHQPSFWEAMEGSSFGQLVIQLRCRRELARVLFFGDTWESELPAKKLREQQGKQQQEQQVGARSGPPSPRDAPEQQPPRKRQRQSEGASPPPPLPRQQQAEDVQGRKEGSQPASLRAPPAGGDAAKAPVPSLNGGGTSSKRTSSSSSSDGEPVLGTHPPAAQRAGTSARRVIGDSSSEGEVAGGGLPGGTEPHAQAVGGGDSQQLAAGSRVRAVVSDSSDEDVPLVARGAVSGSSSEDVPLVVRQARKPAEPQRRSPAAAAAAAGAARASPPAAAAAAGGAARASPPAAAPGSDSARPLEEPKNVWLKEAEFPPGSGKYPMYLKAGPIKKNYFTINVKASDVLLDGGYEGRYEGELVLQEPGSGTTWTVHTNVKEGKGAGQRYFTRLTDFNRDNKLQAHDVLWLQRGPERGRLLFGVWRWGSQEAADFAAKLLSGAGPAKKAVISSGRG